ncbi:uncharacterized protein LOC122802178 [Protopterus annectens]|uniref:uncharacterized protein LOC122802178 n=1 Tax=Protopterus annectens TaxID=7888 RepID=UPI001CFA65ED|nr:uncharacterized protein LOC122802178 [Protopterus annectens]
MDENISKFVGDTPQNNAYAINNLGLLGYNLNVKAVMPADCNRSNLVYVVQCIACEMFYIWKTNRTLKERILEQINDIRNGKPNNALAKHVLDFDGTHKSNQIKKKTKKLPIIDLQSPPAPQKLSSAKGMDDLKTLGDSSADPIIVMSNMFDLLVFNSSLLGYIVKTDSYLNDIKEAITDILITRMNWTKKVNELNHKVFQML